MKTSNLNLTPRASRAFTLIEMIGVLAVIAILAALLIPKIFEAINSARVNNAVVSYNTIKTAVMDHYGKYGRFDSSNGVPVAIPGTGYSPYDQNILLQEALIDKPFQLKIGTNWIVQVRPCVAATVAVDGLNSAYSLATSNSTVNVVIGQYVVEAVIQGVAEADAIAISDRLDGPTLTVATGNNDLGGRIKYTAPASAGAPVDVYMYIAHR